MKRELTRRDFIALSAATATSAMLPKFAMAETETVKYDYESLPPLRETAAKKGILYGSSVEPARLEITKAFSPYYEQDFNDAIARECNLLVAESIMKWDALHPTPEKWDFWLADQLLEYAKKYDMKMRGHTLIWHAAFPAWAEQALKEGRGEALMEEYIAKVAGHYKGKLVSWDVVNEALKGRGEGNEEGLRDTPWLKALGPSYIEKAFRLAAQADPDVQLVYNDYDIEQRPAKSASAIKLLRGLKDKNVPIHALGLQAHIDLETNFAPLKALCEEAKKLGLDIIITELDVFDPSFNTDSKKTDELVAAKLREFLDIVFTVAVPKQILAWGLTDRHSWLSSAQWNVWRNPKGHHIRGLPLDDDLKRKPMWHVLHEFLEKA
ncbi:MAG: endo-1,4-beta-xylanase [Alphaproteobacteria bacterium]